MAGQSQVPVVQLAQQLSDGFTALSGEYQALFEQQRQLESKLSWAKQQVRSISWTLSHMMNTFSSRPAAALQL
jgi:hypothetical protein